jgi:hypothetical protein
MANRQQLRRLLALRHLEEEQSRVRLVAAVGERLRIAGEMEEARELEAEGRRSFSLGVAQHDGPSRAGALVEMAFAQRSRGRIEPHLRAAENEERRQREEYLLRRTDRMQVETLDAEARRQAEARAARRAQQILDDWYGRRSRFANSEQPPAPQIPRAGGAENPPFPPASELEVEERGSVLDIEHAHEEE